jgi:aryl-alcohol dehydrogenase-like predicted oxidoreductase
VKYRRLGDLSLSEIGFGCGGNAGLMVRGSAKEQIEIVAQALDLGVNYFDNAPDYGDGAAETNLGQALKTLKARPIVTSKVEIRAPDLGDIAGHIVRSVEASLQRLGLDDLDVLQIHNGPTRSRPDQSPNSYVGLWLEDFLRPNGALEGLRRVRTDGKVRRLGFVCRGNDREGVQALLDTELFDLINVPYTLLNPTAGLDKPPGFSSPRDYGNVIGLAHGRGVGTAIFSPLAGGALTDQSLGGLDPHRLARERPATPARAQDRERAARLKAVIGRDESLAATAYRFILANPGVTTVIGGFSDAAQVLELTAVSDGAAFPPEDFERLQDLWRRNFGDTPTADHPA